MKTQANTVFEHIMESFDRAKANNYSYEVAIAALLHDLSKIATPEEIYHPNFSHIGHEMRLEVIEGFFKRHRFSLDVKKLSRCVARQHMRMHDITKIKKPVKLIRFLKDINQHLREDYLKACNCDSTLSEEQITLFNKVKNAIENTHIDPEALKGKSVDYIKQYVEQQYVNNFKLDNK